MKHTPPPLVLPASAVLSIRKTEKLSDSITAVSGTEVVSHVSDKERMLQSLMSCWKLILTLLALFHCMVRHGTVRYGSLLGGFPLGTVPGPWYFLVPPQPRFQASRTVTKTWRVNSTDHWLAGENRHYCVTELATRDPSLQPYPLDLNQHSQRRIGRNFCLNKCTFLHQPQNSSVVEEVQMFCSLIAEERIQWELDGATPKEKALCI